MALLKSVAALPLSIVGTQVESESGHDTFQSLEVSFVCNEHKQILLL